MDPIWIILGAILLFALGCGGLLRHLHDIEARNRHDLRTAKSLAAYMHHKFYRRESPEFEVSGDMAGVLSQIDNMVTGLERRRP